MRILIIILFFSFVLIFGMGNIEFAKGQANPGDCDGNGFVNVNDIYNLIEYLWEDGPMPSMPDCDCDGFPGLNYADQLHLEEVVQSGATAYGYPGQDYPVLSDVKFYCDMPIPGNKDSFTVKIYIDVPVGFDIHSYIIPFSFSQDPGTMQAPLTCNFVDTDGTVSAVLPHSGIDSANSIFYITCKGIITPAIFGGNSGLLCSVNFTSGSGTPNTIKMISTKTVLPMLFTANAYEGIPGERVFLPAVVRTLYGDSNCDGVLDVSDAVWIINYIFFSGSPAPGDC